MSFTAIDIVFIILIAILLLRSFLRGFIKEFMTMASIILGLAAAIFFYRPGGQYVRKYIKMDNIPEILAFIAIFAIVYLFIIFIEYLLRDIIRRVNLGWLDSLFGLLFGIIEGIVLVSLIILVLTVQPLFDPALLLEKSFFYHFLFPLIGDAKKFIGNIL